MQDDTQMLRDVLDSITTIRCILVNSQLALGLYSRALQEAHLGNLVDSNVYWMKASEQVRELTTLSKELEKLEDVYLYRHPTELTTDQ